MRRRGTRSAAALLACGVLTAVLAGCSQVVPGSADGGAGGPAFTAGAMGGASTGSATAEGRLESDVVPDECLLNAAEFGALVGGAVRPPRQNHVRRPDGSTGSSCVTDAGTEPLATINVYRVRGATPAGHVRTGATGGSHVLTGVGEAAAVVETQTGPVLQLASPAYLVTILVAGRNPDDDAWRTAAAAALSRLPA